MSLEFNDSERPSADPAGPGSAVTDILADDVLWGLVRPQPAPCRVAQPSVTRPFPEAHLPHDNRINPVRLAGIRAWHGGGERGLGPFQGAQPRADLRQRLLAEARAHLAGVLQPPGTLDTEQQ